MLEDRKAEVPKVDMPGFLEAWVVGQAGPHNRGRFYQTRGELLIASRKERQGTRSMSPHLLQQLIAHAKTQ